MHELDWEIVIRGARIMAERRGVRVRVEGVKSNGRWYYVRRRIDSAPLRKMR